VYRAIFEASPIPDSARAKAIERQKEFALVQSMDQRGLYGSITTSLVNLERRANFQDRSFDEIQTFIRNKEVLLASTPAIQPVSNRNLNRIASGFGHRIDPVYKTVKMHQGLDFAAPQGIPIYATANGVVQFAGNKGNGYGNHVIINHGYGYETLYGHMYKTKARSGQRVKRGEIIGYVGSTGKSTGPHLHYEVHKNNRPIDPVYFFYNDLTPEQFDRILKAAASNNQSLD
jgi:murein DD-endopeptidase MepM/ murein hydrolase activator NlpD